MPRIKTVPSAVPTARKPVHYHLLLRPVLQRRFARSSLWTFVVCCIVSFLVGDRYGWRLLLPWSATFLRGFLIFATLFPVLVIRKADLHVEFKPYTSPVSLVGKEILSISTIHSILAYIVSSACVSYSYLRNVGEQANLSITITRFKPLLATLIPSGYELPRLNERLVYLTYFSVFTATAFGVFQRAIHRTLLPYKSVTAHLRTELVHAAGKRVVVSGLLALSFALTAPVFYVFARPTIWKYALGFARTFVKMPRSSTLPDFPVGLGLSLRSIWLAFLMTAMWEAANLFFDAFITKTPASQGELLSAKSDDPNGTLITGLQNRDKPFTQLAFIAYNSKDRRRAIYSEHGNGPSTWNHILRALLEILAGIKNNHQVAQHSPLAPSQTEIPFQQSEPAPQLPVMQTNIFVSNGMQKLPFGFVRTTDGPKDNLTLPASLDASLWRSRLDFLIGAQSHYVGWPFYPCVEQQAVVRLPHLRLAVCAIQGISQLVVRSAHEDSLGLVQWDIGVLLNCLCVTLTTLQTYVRSLPSRQSHSPFVFIQRNVVTLEQDILIKTIKLAISDIVHEFGHHLDQVGLNTSAAELFKPVLCDLQSKLKRKLVSLEETIFLRQLNDMALAALDPHIGRLIPRLRTCISRGISCQYQGIRTLKNVSKKQIPSRTGVLAIKKGMTALWDAKGNRLPVTILQVSRAQVTSVKTLEKNGYWAVQVGIGLRRPENVTKAMLGHFAAARVAPKTHVGEFRVRDKSGLLPIGSEIDVNHFYEGQFVDVRGRGKGKGFAGVMKRHGFHGLAASHGVSIKHRSGGSTGASQDPGRVLPGKKMAGHMGAKNVTTPNVQIVKVDRDLGLLLVKGPVPGPAKGLVSLRDAIRKPLPVSAAS